ncbi:putative protein kinase RLK-Pelle-SD-2b family [Helianthus annuus]|nr:putative protein kinase RLK-Pelle-SD-2b family [Helianthus annuus]
MARVLYLILSTIFLPFSIVAEQINGTGSVPVGASLTATDNGMPWLSPSGDFAFGFQRIQQDNFLLSIWYDKIPEKTIVWCPKGGPMVPRGSKVELRDGRGLVLSDPQGKEVWTSGSNISDRAYGFMNDTGNFVIVDGISGKVWESFRFPTDTILPTQVMERSGELISKISETNFTLGRFQLTLLQDGNLILRKRDIRSGVLYNTYYRSGTRDSNRSIAGKQLIYDETGYMYVLKGSGQIVDLNRKDAINSRLYYQRATLESNGVFTQYYYPKNPTGNTDWTVLRPLPDYICDWIDGTDGTGACGFNSVCSLDGNRVNCECPKGFSLLDPNDPIGDCKPVSAPTCDEGYDGNQFDFIELTNIDWPGSDYVRVEPTNEETCKTFCLQDCLCAVAIYRDQRCWKKKLPLSNGNKDPSPPVKAFLKYRIGDLPNETPYVSSKEKNNQRSLIVTTISHYPSSKLVDTNLPRFTYQELVEATSEFKDELGKGAFGTVYKGVVGVKTVAVKKLDRVFEDGDKEFKTEVNAIAKTHHKNLVQLLGYCDDGDQRLLVYEYMSNGTLAGFLFGDMKPSWKLRSDVIVGIAKGLAYLHEECSTQVIHCDIKPQNILLDDSYNAKISDFGLAKLWMMNQSRTSTGIRGTKGYVAPEWFRNTPVTVMVDVYSFGVLLLEMISCRKSVVINESDSKDVVAVLTDWAWDCYQEGKLDVFLENDLEALDDYKRLMTFVKVGLWCVQENPSMRPTMRKVIQMLEGVVEVNKPPCPFPFSVTDT